MPLNENEDEAIDAGTEELGRAMFKPVSRGIATAVIGVSAEKLVEYSVIALIVIFTAGGIIIYVFVKHGKKIKRAIGRAKTIKRNKAKAKKLRFIKTHNL